MTKEALEALNERVDKFNRLSLPGQMPVMHMGTSYLVNDLWRRVKELNDALEQQQNWIQRAVWALDHASGMAAVHSDFDFQQTLREIVNTAPKQEKD